MTHTAFQLKVKQKLISLARRYRSRIRVDSVDRFFARHWRGEDPESGYFASRTRPCFFFDPNQRDTYGRLLRERFGDNSTAAIHRADQAMEHRFDLLGSGLTSLGENIDWHTDLKSGITWPSDHHSRISTVNFEDSGDIKSVWELSRLQHVTDLGRAYWLNRDRRYVTEFVDLLTDWEDKNPVGYGPNWTCAMEVAIRAINIVWGLYFFSADQVLNQGFVKRVVRLLYYHGLHIERNLEAIAPGSNTNHLLSNYLGLF